MDNIEMYYSGIKSTTDFTQQNQDKTITNIEQAISARERALCQLTVCFELQSGCERRK